MLKVASQTEGVKLLTDVDLRILKARIEGTPSTHRLNLGIAATFGLPQEMFAGKDALQTRGMRIVELAQEVGKDLNDWLHAHACAKAEAIENFAQANLPRYAIQIPRAFLGIVARDALQKQIASGKMAAFAATVFGFHPFKDDDERLAHVHQRLLDQGSRIMAGDWSQLAGDPELVKLKKEIFRRMLEGVNDEAELERQLTFGSQFLKSHLVPVADEIRRLGEQPVSIVVTGLEALGDSDVLDRIAETVRSLDGLAPRGTSASQHNGRDRLPCMSGVCGDAGNRIR